MKDASNVKIQSKNLEVNIVAQVPTHRQLYHRCGKTEAHRFLRS